MEKILLPRSFFYLIFCLILLTGQGSAQVRCAGSRAEAEERLKHQRQEAQAILNAYNSAASSPEMSVALARKLIQDDINGRISRNELNLPIQVVTSKENSAYIDVQIDARSVPISVPDGRADFTIGFYASDNNLISRATYSMPICSGKNNRSFNIKPKTALRVNVESFNAVSLTYSVPNINVLMSIEKGNVSRDVIAEAAEEEQRRKEEEEKTEELIKKLTDPGLMSPECQVTEILSNRELIESADAIVIAKPVNLKDKSAYTNKNSQLIKFEVKKVLKGDPVLQQFTLNGILTKDYYYREELDCVPNSYGKDGTYLIFLKKVDNSFVLFWSPKASVNRRISGENDDWVKEVKKELLLISSMK